MKALITKIQNGKIFAKSVNPLGEKPNSNYYRYKNIYDILINNWQQAESERVELELHAKNYMPEDLYLIPTYYYTRCSKDGFQIEIGDSIQVTREENFFKII